MVMTPCILVVAPGEKNGNDAVYSGGRIPVLRRDCAKDKILILTQKSWTLTAWVEWVPYMRARLPGKT